MSAHTPGPWEVGSSGTIVTLPNGGRILADILYPGNLKREEHRANARLIAAAPRVLAALKMVTAEYAAVQEIIRQQLRVWDGPGSGPGTLLPETLRRLFEKAADQRIDEAIAAIAQAEGATHE